MPLRGCVKAALVLSLLGAACATVGLNGSVGAAPTAPVIDSVPTSPDTSSGNQPVIELMYDQSYPVQVTVVAPGIAVYSGVIDAAQANLNPFLSRTDPAAPTSAPLPPPANSAFVARVSTLLGLIGQTASGASLLHVLGAAHPLPSSADLASASGSVSWGDVHTTYVNADDGSGSGINIVIGMTPRSNNSPGEAYALNGRAMGDGTGTVSAISIPARGSLVQPDDQNGYTYVTPDTTLFHELRHGADNLVGANSGQGPIVYTRTDPTTGNTSTALDASPEELATFGGPQGLMAINGYSTSASGSVVINPDPAITQAVAYAVGVRRLVTTPDLTTQLALSQQAALRRSIATATEVNYAAQRGLVARSDYYVLQRRAADMRATLYEPTSLTLNYSQADMTSPLTSTNLRSVGPPVPPRSCTRPASGTTNPGTAPSGSVPGGGSSAGSPTSGTSSSGTSSSGSDAGAGAAGSAPTSALASNVGVDFPECTPTYGDATTASLAVNSAYQAVVKAGLTPSCVIAPGPIFVDDSALDAAGQAAVSAAMADWNAPGGAVTFSTTPLYRGQVADVTFAEASLSANTFAIGGTCSAMTTIGLNLTYQGGAPLSRSGSELVVVQALGQLMGDSGGASSECGSALNVTQVLLATGVCPSAGPTAWDIAQEAVMYPQSAATASSGSSSGATSDPSASSAPGQSSAYPLNAHIYSGSLALGPTTSPSGAGALAWSTPSAASTYDWTYEPVTATSANGFVVNAASGECLAFDAVEGTSRVFQAACSGRGASDYVETTWKITPVSGGVQLSQSAISGCLATPQGAGSATMGTCGGGTVVGFGPSASPGTATPSGAPTYSAAAQSIVGQGSWLCLNAASPAPGTSVASLTTQACGSAQSAAGEQWTYVHQSQQLWVYGNPNSALGAQEPQALCLAVPLTSTSSSSATTSGPPTYSKVPLATTCAPGATNEQWQVRGNGTIMNPASGQCLNVDGASTSAGAAIIMWNCNNDNNEQWAVQSGFVPGSGIYAGFGSGRGLVDHLGQMVLSDGPSDSFVWRTLAPNGGQNRGLLFDRTTGQCYGKVPNGYGFGGCNQNAANQQFTLTTTWNQNFPNRFNGLVRFLLGDWCLDALGANDSTQAVVEPYRCQNYFGQDQPVANEQWRILSPTFAPPAPSRIRRSLPETTMTTTTTTSTPGVTPSTIVDSTLPAPTISTTVSAPAATTGASISDAVTFASTEGATLQGTWTLYGPVPSGADGTCASANWDVSLPIFSTGSFSVTGDGTTNTPASAPLSVAGCYTYAESVQATSLSDAAASSPGQAGEVASITPPLVTTPGPASTKLIQPLGVSSTFWEFTLPL